MQNPNATTPQPLSADARKALEAALDEWSQSDEPGSLLELGTALWQAACAYRNKEIVKLLRERAEAWKVSFAQNPTTVSWDRAIEAGHIADAIEQQEIPHG